MDKFIKTIEDYEKKMILLLEETKKRELHARNVIIITIVCIGIGTYIILNWKDVKKESLVLVDYAETLLDWFLVRFLNYKIIIE